MHEKIMMLNGSTIKRTTISPICREQDMGTLVTDIKEDHMYLFDSGRIFRITATTKTKQVKSPTYFIHLY